MKAFPGRSAAAPGGDRGRVQPVLLPVDEPCPTCRSTVLWPCTGCGVPVCNCDGDRGSDSYLRPEPVLCTTCADATAEGG